MSEKNFEEMEPAKFVGITDDTIEQLLRQLGPDDALAREMLTGGKAEIRRRILEPATTKTPVPIVVEIERKDLDEIVFPHRFCGNFHATPYVVTLVGSDAQEQKVTNVFFSAAEADAFIAGLRAARLLGLPFKEIPDIEDIPEPEKDAFLLDVE